MNTIMISLDEPSKREPLGVPVVCLYLYPRRPDLSDLEKFAIWQQVRDLVNANCGGEAAFVGRDGGLLFYPNHHTPMLTALLTEPAFFDVLEEHDLDARALKLFFCHNDPWSNHPGGPGTFALQAEEQLLPAFNAALQQMRRYSGALQPIAQDEPDRRVLCGPMPPMTWFVEPLSRTPADPTAAGTLQKTGTDL